MKKTFMIALVLLCACVALQADTFIKTKMHTDPVSFGGQAQPATDKETQTWISKNKSAQIMDEQSVITDMDKKVLYMVFPKDKTYLEAQFPFDIMKFLPEQAASMAGMMKVSMKVKANGQTKKIGGWNCSGYDVEMTLAMGKGKIAVWASTEVPFDWKDYMEKGGAELIKATTQGIMDEASIAEMKKIAGYTIAQEAALEVMGMTIKTSSVVIEIKDKPAPAGTFDVPAGYKKVDKLPMKGM